MENNFLVGYTGFVGSNLAVNGQFTELYHSKNIDQSYGKQCNRLYYSGVYGTKWMANRFPEIDKENILAAIENIKRIEFNKLILISTADVYGANAQGHDESFDVSRSSDCAYGDNRAYLEKWVQENVEDYLIIRIPGLYGENLKKNVIYDLIHYYPNTIEVAVYDEIKQADKKIAECYSWNELLNGYSVTLLADKVSLRKFFADSKYNSIWLTNPNSEFQFYNLKRLYGDIEIAVQNKLHILNVATEPIMLKALYADAFKGKSWALSSAPIKKYDFKTRYDHLFGGDNGYILDSNKVLSDLKDYINKAIVALTCSR